MTRYRTQNPPGHSGARQKREPGIQGILAKVSVSLWDSGSSASRGPGMTV
jgi:hypothetical protein